MIKYLLIFIFGVIETYIYTGWALTATQKKKWVSSILMFLYMTIYLFILDSAFKDTNSKLMIITYATSCGVGNFIRVRQEKK
jgi:uncharacterized protein YebE (UPF0316 family)